MRLWLLYLRSRLACPALAGLALIAGLSWITGNRWGGQRDLFSVMAVMAPLAAAGIICATIDSPFGELERSVSRPLDRLRFGQLGALLIVAAATLTGAATAWSGVDVSWQLARNLLGLSGLGLLSVRLLGARLSWAPPLGFATLALLQSAVTTGDPPIWAWVVQPAGHDTATIIALVLLIAGVAQSGLIGVRGVNAADASR